jgi:hypothetical protein
MALPNRPSVINHWSPAGNHSSDLHHKLGKLRAHLRKTFLENISSELTLQRHHQFLLQAQKYVRQAGCIVCYKIHSVSQPGPGR